MNFRYDYVACRSDIIFANCRWSEYSINFRKEEDKIDHRFLLIYFNTSHDYSFWVIKSNIFTNCHNRFIYSNHWIVDISIQIFKQCVFCVSFRWSVYWLRLWHRITNVFSNFLLTMKLSSWWSSLSSDEILNEKMIMYCYLQFSKYCWICS